MNLGGAVGGLHFDVFHSGASCRAGQALALALPPEETGTAEGDQRHDAEHLEQALRYPGRLLDACQARYATAAGIGAGELVELGTSRSPSMPINLA